METGLLENESEAEARAREEQAREENRRRQEAAQRAEAAAQQREEARRQAELRANASPTVDEDYQRYLEYGAGGLDNPYHPDNLGTVHTVDGRVVESSTSKDGQVRYTFADGNRETFQRDDSGNVVRADGSAPLRESFSGSRRLVPDFSSVADPTEPDATETRADLDRSFMEDGLSRTNTVEDSASGLLDGTRMTGSEETPPDNVSQETPAEVVSTTPTAFTGRVNVIADGDSDPVEFANQQVDEANAAAAEAEAAHEEAQLAYVPGWAYYGSSREELLKDLTPKERAHEYIRGEDATAGFTIDFDPEQGEGQPAHYSTTGNRADFFRQHFEAEVGRVNDAAAPLAEAAKKIEELQASGQKVYTDSPEWREYLSAKSGFDDAVELAHTRLQLGRNSGETRFDALERYVSGVVEKHAAAGHPDAYANWQKEYAEAGDALKAAEGWQEPLAPTAGTSGEGVGHTMSEGVAPATHRLVETPEGLPSLVVPIEREQQPASGDGYTMSEAIRGGNLNDAVLDEERGLYVHPTTRETWKQADVDAYHSQVSWLRSQGYRLDQATGEREDLVTDRPQPNVSGSQFQVRGIESTPAEAVTGRAWPERPNAELMAGFHGSVRNFNEQMEGLRALEGNQGGRHFGLDRVIESAQGYAGPQPEPEGASAFNDSGPDRAPGNASYADDYAAVEMPASPTPFVPSGPQGIDDPGTGLRAPVVYGPDVPASTTVAAPAEVQNEGGGAQTVPQLTPDLSSAEQHNLQLQQQLGAQTVQDLQAEQRELGHLGDHTAASGTQALERLKGLTADNYVDVLRSGPRYLHLNGERIDVHEHFPELDDPNLMADTAGDTQFGIEYRQDQAAKWAAAAQSGALTIDEPRNPGYIVIDKPEFINAETTPWAAEKIAEVNRYRQGEFNKQVQEAASEGKFIVLRDAPSSNWEDAKGRAHSVADWVVPGYGLYTSHKEAMKDGIITSNERSGIAMELGLAAVDVAPIPVTAAGSVAGRALKGTLRATGELGQGLVDVGGNVIRASQVDSKLNQLHGIMQSRPDLMEKVQGLQAEGIDRLTAYETVGYEHRVLPDDYGPIVSPSRNFKVSHLHLLMKDDPSLIQKVKDFEQGGIDTLTAYETVAKGQGKLPWDYGPTQTAPVRSEPSVVNFETTYGGGYAKGYMSSPYFRPTDEPLGGAGLTDVAPHAVPEHLRFHQGQRLQLTGDQRIEQQRGGGFGGSVSELPGVGTYSQVRDPSGRIIPVDGSHAVPASGQASPYIGGGRYVEPGAGYPSFRQPYVLPSEKYGEVTLLPYSYGPNPGDTIYFHMKGSPGGGSSGFWTGGDTSSGYGRLLTDPTYRQSMGLPPIAPAKSGPTLATPSSPIDAGRPAAFPPAHRTSPPPTQASLSPGQLTPPAGAAPLLPGQRVNAYASPTAAEVPMVQTNAGLIVPASAINPALVQPVATPLAQPVSDATPSVVPGLVDRVAGSEETVISAAVEAQTGLGLSQQTDTATAAQVEAAQKLETAAQTTTQIEIAPGLRTVVQPEIDIPATGGQPWEIDIADPRTTQPGEIDIPSPKPQPWEIDIPGPKTGTPAGQPQTWEIDLPGPRRAASPGK